MKQAPAYSMEGLRAALWIVLALVVMWDVQGNEDIDFIISRIEDLNQDVIQIEERVAKKIDWAKITLKSELKKHISEHVRDSLAGILQGQSVEEMMRSQVITEVRQLRRGNHQMKRQLHHVLKTLKDVQDEMNTYKKALYKTTGNECELKMCTTYVTDFTTVKRDLEQCKQDALNKDNVIKKLKDSLIVLNQTNQLKLKETVSTDVPDQVTEASTASIVNETTTQLPTPRKFEEERSRIIVAPLYSSTLHQFRELNIHRKTSRTYRGHSVKYVLSIAYVSKLRRLLIGLRYPNRIESSELDATGVETVQEHVRTYGMSVDEGRQIVFLTTYKPRRTISRMTTYGRNLTVVIDLNSYSDNLYGIVVNPKERKIYGCTYDKVLTVTYEGRGLQTLATGTAMYTLALDNMGSVLYYNDEKKLMRILLSEGLSDVVTTLPVTPSVLRYYRDVLYYSSCCNATNLTVGEFHLQDNTTSNILQTDGENGVMSYAICLVP